MTFFRIYFLRPCWLCAEFWSIFEPALLSSSLLALNSKYSRLEDVSLRALIHRVPRGVAVSFFSDCKSETFSLSFLIVALQLLLLLCWIYWSYDVSFSFFFYFDASCSSSLWTSWVTVLDYYIYTFVSMSLLCFWSSVAFKAESCFIFLLIWRKDRKVISMFLFFWYFLLIKFFNIADLFASHIRN